MKTYQVKLIGVSSPRLISWPASSSRNSMHAISKRKAPKSVEYHGRFRRLRIAIYDDDTARLCYRRIHFGSLYTVKNVNAWRFVGDFTIEQARHIASVFGGTVDKLAELRGVKQP